MRRTLSLAAFLLLLTSLPLYAQRGGMRSAGHSTGFLTHGSVAHPAFRGMHTGFGSFGDRRFQQNFFRGTFRHRCFGCRRFGFPWWWAGYSPYLWSDSYDDYQFDQQQEREIALANEMDRLNLEEQRLRQREDALDRERDQNAYARRPEPQAGSQPTPATVLVFRDQHQQEVQNYAIADGTLWILTAQSARKIPLSELDLDATQKVNDDRGVEFQMPR